MAASIRSKFIYNNMMYTVAAHLVERTTGLSYASFLTDKLLRPLGMHSTFVQPSSAIAAGQADRMASGHYYDEQRLAWKEFPAFDAPEGLGAGSIVTTVEDSLKWIRALVKRNEPISENVYADLMRPRMIMDRDTSDLDPRCSPTLYALGWEVYWYRGHQIVMHDGLIQGSGSTQLFIPSADFGACIFGNSAGIEDVVYVLSRELIDAALDVPQAERPDWEGLHEARRSKNEKEEREAGKELRDRLQTGGDGQEQIEVDLPDLAAFAGDYWNVGYHKLTVQADGKELSADGADRSMPITLAFEPMRAWRDVDNTDTTTHVAMIAHLSDSYEGGDELLECKFVCEGSKAVSMGIMFEDDLLNGEMIWFERMARTTDETRRSVRTEL